MAVRQNRKGTLGDKQVKTADAHGAALAKNAAKERVAAAPKKPRSRPKKGRALQAKTEQS